jgi:exopolyphosphatase
MLCMRLCNSRSIRMTRSISSLNTFLAHAKSAVKTPKTAVPVLIVVGNESADLDSLSSSIVYAYLQSLKDKTKTVVPLTNIPKEELDLRPEYKWLLKQAHLSTEEVITLSDISSDTMQNAEWVLVDHNVPTGPVAAHLDKVTGVIDHHSDEKKIPQGVQPRVIEKCGSCSSLVVNHFKDVWQNLESENPEQKLVNNNLSTLAAGAILIDTTNLTMKTTPADTDAMKFLKTRWPQEANQTTFFEELSKAKVDLHTLSCQDVFQKDYKAWSTKAGRLGISSSVLNIKSLLEKAKTETDKHSPGEAFQESIERFMKKNNLTVWALMTTANDDKGNFRRELVIWTHNEAAKESLEKFMRQGTTELGLEPWKDVSLEITAGWSRILYQNQLEKSRKEVAPLLRKNLDEDS